MELPVKPKDDRYIIDEVGVSVCFARTTEDRDQIVQAINSHEKLVEYAQHKSNCLKHAIYDIIDSDLRTRCTCGLEQALEAEKKE